MKVYSLVERINSFGDTLETLSEIDLDKIEKWIGDLHAKILSVKAKFNDGAIIKKKDAVDKSAIRKHLHRVESRLTRIDVDSFHELRDHIDILLSKIVGAIKKLAKADVITNDEGDAYILAVDNWYTTKPKPFTMNTIRKSFSRLSSMFIDELELEEDCD